MSNNFIFEFSTVQLARFLGARGLAPGHLAPRDQCYRVDESISGELNFKVFAVSIVFY